MHNLLIDTDIGGEMTDAAAVTLAASSPEVRLLGVTTVTGNTLFRASAAGELLELLGRPDVPIAAGINDQSAEPSWEKRVFTQGNHSRQPLGESWAAKLIVKTITDNPHQVTLVGIGPLSTVARALELCPELPVLTKGLAVMGGMMTSPMVDGTEVPRGFEYNFQADPAAAERVLKAGFQLTIIPGDLTFQKECAWTEDDICELETIEHPAVRILAELNRRSVDAMRKDLPLAGFSPTLARPWINDEALMMHFLQPDLFEAEELTFEWSMTGKYPRLTPGNTGIRATWVSGCRDFAALRKSILERLAHI